MKQKSMSDYTKGHWTQEEDCVIVNAVSQGESKWSEIAKLVPGNRIGKQCRERWFNHLNPDLKKSPWSDEEDQLLISSQAALGNSWSKVAQMLVGRSENEVKNRWYSAVIRKKTSSQVTQHPKTYQTESTDGGSFDSATGSEPTLSSPSFANCSQRNNLFLSDDDLISLRIAEVFLKGLQATDRQLYRRCGATPAAAACCFEEKVPTNECGTLRRMTRSKKEEEKSATEIAQSPDVGEQEAVCANHDDGVNIKNAADSVIPQVQSDFHRSVCARLRESEHGVHSSLAGHHQLSGLASSCSYLLLEPLTVSGLTTPWFGLSACASPSWLGSSAPPSPRS